MIMLFQTVLDIVKSILFSVLDFIQIPSFPVQLTDSIDTVLNTIFNNLGLLGLAVRWNTVVVAVPLLIAIINMQHIYDGVMWILRKIPMLGIE